MSQSQYEELFAESENLLDQMTHVVEPTHSSQSSRSSGVRKRKVKKWPKRVVILLVLLVLLITLAMAGGKFLQILGGHFPLRYEAEVQSGPRQMSEQDLEQETDVPIDDDMARVRVSLEIKVEKSRKVGRVVVQNLPTNETRLRFSVIGEGETEPFFRSELLDPGYSVSEIPLKNEHLQGEHKAQILLEFYEKEQEEKITESIVDVIINAKESN